jgi:hypothetical protein
MTTKVCGRAARIGSLVLALTLAGAVTGSTLFTTSEAAAIVKDFSPMATFNGIACASASQCIGVGTVVSSPDSGAASALDPVSGDLSNGQSVQLIGSTGFLNAVSCPSSSDCLAVGENPTETDGIAVPLDPDTATVPSGQSAQTISGIVMTGLACASSTQCLAVGHNAGGTGLAVALNPATGAILGGQSVQTIAGTGGVGLEGVACPSATLCVAVGENSGRSAGAAVPLNPATGAVLAGQGVQSITTKGVLIAVACPTATQCLAVGFGASEPSVAVPIDPNTGALSSGQSDQSISTRAQQLTGVSCPSSSLCLAVGNDTGDPSTGQAVPIDPTSATIVAGQSIQTLAGTGSLNAVVCPSAARCVAAGSSFESAGAATEILDPATAEAPSSPTTPTTTPGGTGPAPVSPAAPTTTTTTTPGTTSSGQSLAFTGSHVALLLALGVGLVLGGCVLVGVSARSGRKRPRAQP